MAFTYEYKELKKMEILNKNQEKTLRGGDIFIESGETLLKAVTTNSRKQLEYLSTIPEHENVIKPLEVGDIIYQPGTTEKEYTTIYRMIYLQNAETLLSLHYNKDISYEEKMQYTEELSRALQFLHQYIILADIHSKNIWIHDGKAYLGDLDNSKKCNSKSPIQASYYLSFLQKLEHTKRTDIIKLYIECLSFLINVNLTPYIDKYGYRSFCKTVLDYDIPKDVKNFLRLSTNKREFKQLGNEAYQFNQFIPSDTLTLERKLSFMDPYYKMFNR